MLDPAQTVEFLPDLELVVNLLSVALTVALIPAIACITLKAVVMLFSRPKY